MLRHIRYFWNTVKFYGVYTDEAEMAKGSNTRNKWTVQKCANNATRPITGTHGCSK